MTAYQFDKADAVRYGVNEAVFLWRLRWWLRENRIKGRNRRDGRTWSYDNAADLSQVFEFWSESQVRRIIASLVEQGVVMKSNYNQKANDHTLWLALCDESALETMGGGADESSEAGAGGSGATPGRRRGGLASRIRQANPESGLTESSGRLTESSAGLTIPSDHIRDTSEDSTSEDAVDKKPPPESPCEPEPGPARPATGKRPAKDAAAASVNASHLGGGPRSVSPAFIEGMRLELNALGINAPDGWIEAKVACYGPDRFERQVRWLPRRSACTLLILAAALRDDYEDPGRSRVAGPSAGPRVPRQVTRVGEGGLRKRELLAEIRRHGRAVVLKEMAEHHDRCRRGDTPDDVLSRQCEMMGFLTAATDEEIAARLTDTPAGKEPEQGPPGKGSHARRIPGVAAVPPPGEEADTRRGDY